MNWPNFCCFFLMRKNGNSLKVCASKALASTHRVTTLCLDLEDHKYNQIKKNYEEVCIHTTHASVSLEMQQLGVVCPLHRAFKKLQLSLADLWQKRKPPSLHTKHDSGQLVLKRETVHQLWGQCLRKTQEGKGNTVWQVISVYFLVNLLTRRFYLIYYCTKMCSCGSPASRAHASFVCVLFSCILSAPHHDAQCTEINVRPKGP